MSHHGAKIKYRQLCFLSDFFCKGRKIGAFQNDSPDVRMIRYAGFDSMDHFIFHSIKIKSLVWVFKYFTPFSGAFQADHN